jgi:hypothetical protein
MAALASMLAPNESTPRTPPGTRVVLEGASRNDPRLKLQLFAGFGVPEVWRVVDDEVVIYRFTHGEYGKVAAGIAFPEFSPLPLICLTRSGRTSSRAAWRKESFAWAKELRSVSSGP